MPMGIVIAVAAVLVIAAAIISHFVTMSNMRKNAESKIGNAESKAREIIDDAVKTAEAKKKESLLEIKEESIRTKNELEKETKERRAETFPNSCSQCKISNCVLDRAIVPYTCQKVRGFA